MSSYADQSNGKSPDGDDELEELMRLEQEERASLPPESAAGDQELAELERLEEEERAGLASDPGQPATGSPEGDAELAELERLMQSELDEKQQKKG